MKKTLFLINFLLLLTSRAQASEQPPQKKLSLLINESSLNHPPICTFLDLPDFVIQQEIMPKLDDTALVHLAKSSKHMNELVKSEFNNRMLKQREEFKKKLPENGTELNLAYSKLEMIYKEVFDSPEFKNLNRLYLNDNKLIHLDKNIFNGLHHLQQLFLFKNQLTKLDKNIFNRLNNLQSLDLTDNQLTHLDKDGFTELNNLQWLLLNRNQLTPENIQELKNALPNVSFD